jgi:hypothetical protein
MLKIKQSKPTIKRMKFNNGWGWHCFDGRYSGYGWTHRQAYQDYISWIMPNG